MLLHLLLLSWLPVPPQKAGLLQWLEAVAAVKTLVLGMQVSGLLVQAANLEVAGLARPEMAGSAWVLHAHLLVALLAEAVEAPVLGAGLAGLCPLVASALMVAAPQKCHHSDHPAQGWVLLGLTVWLGVHRQLQLAMTVRH